MDKYNRFFICLIPVLILGLYNGLSAFPICLTLLIIRLCTTDKHTAGIFLLMYGGIMGGAIRLMYPFVPIYGLMLNSIGIILLWNEIRKLFKEDYISFFLLVLVILIFGVCYLYGPRTEFATTKYSKMIEHGIFMLFGYYSICNSRLFSPVVLTQVLLLTAISLFAFDIQYYHMTPGGIFDFDWFRLQETSFFYANDRVGYLASYQELGILALLSITIFLSQAEIKMSQVIVYTLFASFLILSSSARQAIFGLVIVIALRYTIFNTRHIRGAKPSHSLLSIVAFVFVAGLIILYALPLLNIGVITSTLQSGDEGRTILYAEAIQMIKDNPLLGLGLGGFEHFTISDQPWPHNFFLEILCETGFLGLAILCIIVVKYFTSHNVNILTLTNQRMFYFLIVSAVLSSYMVSADFRLSISVFSALFAVRMSSNIESN